MPKDTYWISHYKIPCAVQAAFCARSSNIVYSGVVGAGTTTENSFGANPNYVWAKEVGGTSNHWSYGLNDVWFEYNHWSGHPFSVRCVVALNKKVSG